MPPRIIKMEWIKVVEGADWNAFNVDLNAALNLNYYIVYYGVDSSGKAVVLLQRKFR